MVLYCTVAALFALILSRGVFGRAIFVTLLPCSLAAIASGCVDPAMTAQSMAAGSVRGYYDGVASIPADKRRVAYQNVYGDPILGQSVHVLAREGVKGAVEGMTAEIEPMARAVTDAVMVSITKQLEVASTKIARSTVGGAIDELASRTNAMPEWVARAMRPVLAQMARDIAREAAIGARDGMSGAGADPQAIRLFVRDAADGAGEGISSGLIRGFTHSPVVILGSLVSGLALIAAIVVAIVVAISAARRHAGSAARLELLAAATERLERATASNERATRTLLEAIERSARLPPVRSPDTRV